MLKEYPECDEEERTEYALSTHADKVRCVAPALLCVRAAAFPSTHTRLCQADTPGLRHVPRTPARTEQLPHNVVCVPLLFDR